MVDNVPIIELPLLEEARRQLDICNACRYCEGICAVFPALERRSLFDQGDITYLANLCHDCRSCFDACPYAPPHELGVDIPRLLSGVREATHRHYGSPRGLASVVNSRLAYALALCAAAVIFTVAATILGSGIDTLFAEHKGAGSFYRVVPWLGMMLPFMAISLVVVAVLITAGIRFWRDIDTRPPTPLQEVRSLFTAARDAATLKYLRGGGTGCDYPSERPSYARLALHSLVFYGFLSAFLATVVAAIYQDILGRLPPYAVLSVPVILGIIGGAAMIAGCIGLLALKRDAEPARAAAGMRTMDIAFLATLILVNVSGFGVLALRETALLGIVLDLHLGVTAALFVTLPYGKFAHSVYRSLAVLRNRIELGREDRARRRPA